VKRYLYPIIVVVAAAAVGSWTVRAGGRSSAAFLTFATLSLGWVLWQLYRAAQALVREAPAVEAGGIATGKRRKELEREKQSLLKALKELDFDHEMGKVSDKDFADISGQYRARAMGVMRQLDDAGRDYETMIAKDVAERLKADAGSPPAASAPSKPNHSDVSDKCAKCSTRNDQDAEFCKKCGNKLVRDAS
jgi:hypothetical protein